MEKTEAALLRALKEKHETVTGAESLTGGLVAEKITSVPGASAVFPGSFVTYCDTMKHALLGVPEELLKTEGAISAACAAAMAEGAAKKAGASLAYATTGNAGPDAQEGKPVGLVFTGVYYKGKTAAREHHFTGDRAAIREQAAEAALLACLETITEQP